MKMIFALSFFTLFMNVYADMIRLPAEVFENVEITYEIFRGSEDTKRIRADENFMANDGSVGLYVRTYNLKNDYIYHLVFASADQYSCDLKFSYKNTSPERTLKLLKAYSCEVE